MGTILFFLGLLIFVAWICFFLMEKDSIGEGASAVVKSSQLADKARQDIATDGWHLVRAEGENGDYLYTVGLWKTYRHPELIVFARSEDNSDSMVDLVADFAALVRRITVGESLKSGGTYPRIFGDCSGAFRLVADRWVPYFLDVGGEVYEHFAFPVQQLFWPDEQGFFPWQSDFEVDEFSHQPILFEENVILANVGWDLVERVMEEEENPQAFVDSFYALVMKKGNDPADTDPESILRSWGWRMGSGAELLFVTLFGDLFFKRPDGRIYFLDTGCDFLQEVAADHHRWRRVVCDAVTLFFHPSVLLDLRFQKVLPEDGEVYSWIQSPLLGGEEVADNLDIISATTHLMKTGEAAQSTELWEPPEIVVEMTDMTPLSVIL